MTELSLKSNYDHLTSDNIEFLLSAIFSRIDDLPPGIRVDLSQCKFFDPYALIFLTLTAKELEKRGSSLAFIYPEDRSAMQYLKTIGFPEAVKGKINYENYSRSSSVLLRLSEITSSSDINNIVTNIIDSIGTMLSSHLNYTDTDRAQLLTALTELCQNILDHSKSAGYAAMQLYRSGTGNKFAVIGVGDLGIGIKESLSERYDTTRWTDSIAIVNSLKSGVSRLPQRGLGLFRIKNIAEKYKGSLRIRSNKGLVSFRQKITSKTTAPFPGTQISLYLRENRRLV